MGAEVVKVLALIVVSTAIVSAAGPCAMGGCLSIGVG